MLFKVVDNILVLDWQGMKFSQKNIVTFFALAIFFAIYFYLSINLVLRWKIPRNLYLTAFDENNQFIDLFVFFSSPWLLNCGDSLWN